MLGAVTGENIIPHSYFFAYTAYRVHQGQPVPTAEQSIVQPHGLRDRCAGDRSRTPSLRGDHVSGIDSFYFGEQFRHHARCRVQGDTGGETATTYALKPISLIGTYIGGNRVGTVTILTLRVCLLSWYELL